MTNLLSFYFDSKKANNSCQAIFNNIFNVLVEFKLKFSYDQMRLMMWDLKVF